MSLEHRQDRLLLGRRDGGHGMPARRTVIERARGPALAPAPRAALAELQIRAGAAMIPAVGDRSIDELQQPMLRGRLDPSRAPATQSQRPFPSASINLTPISFSASESRAISALAADSPGPGPWPALPPGLDSANASTP